MDVQNCIARITNGQETAKVLAHFCYNNSISNIESVKKEFIINLGTVYNKLSRYLLKTMKEFIRFWGCSVRKGENFFWVKFSSFLYVVKIWYINRTVLIVVICLQTSASICKNLFFVRLLDNMFLSFGIIIYVLMWVYLGRIVWSFIIQRIWIKCECILAIVEVL